jgi:serine/threonine protein kinase
MSRGSLLSILRNSGVSLQWPRRLSLAIGIARGMQFLHKIDRIHRDLKSANVLVSEAWRAKVSDFGTARLLKFDRTYSLVSKSVRDEPSIGCGP